jgi:MFS family permease
MYLGSQFLSNLGSQMLSVAVGWQVYAITHRAIDLGYVGLVQFVPSFALSLPAGSVADRLDRGRIVAVSELALAGCALALFALASTGAPAAGPIYPILFAAGVARAFGGPAGQALLPGLVPPDHFANAVTWGSTFWQITTVVGPSLGGLLYGAAGAGPGAGGGRWVYGACACILALASLLAFSIPPRPLDRAPEEFLEESAPVVAAPEGISWSTVMAGFRYVRSQPVILGSITLDLFAVLLGGATALLPVYASDVLRIGPSGLGLLRSAPGIGAAAMAIGLAYRPLGRRAGPKMLACVALFGAATIVFGLSRSLPLSFAALLVLGASDMVSVVVRSTVVQLRTPSGMRGRVSAVNMLFIAGSSELGELESGLTAAWFGAVPAVVLGGIGTLMVVAMVSIFVPELRAVDRLDEVGPA